MANIKNKNELKRRIELFLDDELDYSINEDFCKETMKMMREFIGHTSHRLDCEESRVKSLKSKLKNYKDLEEQGLLLRLPCKVGDCIYRVNTGAKEPIIKMRVLAVNYKQFYKDITVIRKDRTVIRIYAINDIDMGESCYLLEDFGKTIFLTKEEAEQKLKEMESD